jgi:hypothetical protein
VVAFQGEDVERVLEVLRVTPAVNLVREEPNGPLKFMFLDGLRMVKPVDLAMLG